MFQHNEEGKSTNQKIVVSILLSVLCPTVVQYYHVQPEVMMTQISIDIRTVHYYINTAQ